MKTLLIISAHILSSFCLGQNSDTIVFEGIGEITISKDSCKECKEVFEELTLLKVKKKKGKKTYIEYMDGYNKVMSATYDKDGVLKSVNTVKRAYNPSSQFDSLKRESKTNGLISIEPNLRCRFSKFSPVVIGIGIRENGLKQGKWIYFHQLTGEKYAEVYYENDKAEKEFLTFHYSNQELNSKHIMINNCRHGVYVNYRENGQLSEIASYICDDIKDWHYFKKNGKEDIKYRQYIIENM